MTAVAAIPGFAQRLRLLTWRDMARRAWLILLGMLMLELVLPADFKDGARLSVVVAPMLPFIAKDLSHWPDALARLRAAIAARAWRRVLTACLPPELIGLLRLDAALRRGCVQWLRRRPQPPLPAGQAFTYLEQGAYRTGVAIALLATLVELPLDAALLPLFVKDPHKLHLLHGLCALGAMSTLAWVLGDRWLVGRGCHVLDADGLQLRIGARTGGTIPLAALADCRRMEGTPADWCREHAIAPHKTLLASPLDKPNTVLILTADSPVRLSHMGVERSGLDCVFLYVDRPERLRLALGAGRQERTIGNEQG
jgi:hypothetical protein